MKMLRGLASYCAFVGVLAVGVVGGGAWLLRPDPSMTAEARAPVIPQKMLDSIERRKPAPIPVVAAPILRPEPPAPVMQEATVSLPMMAIPHRPAKVVSARSSKQKKRRPTLVVARAQALVPATAQAAAPAAAVVSTARTDFPY